MPPTPGNTDVVILCGGMGTRLQSVLNDRPKPLAEINHRPFLKILVDYVANFGFRRFILCSGYRGNQIKDYFASLNDDRTYILSNEDSPLGTAGALKKAENLIQGENFLALNGDSYCEVPLDDLLQYHSSHRAVATLALTHVEEAGDYGGIAINEEGEILAFQEKVKNSKPDWINAGVYLFQTSLLKSIAPDQKVSLEFETFPSLIGKGLYGFTTQRPLYDIGTPERLELARKHLT